MPKQTRLGEDAEIYQPRKEQSEKQKLRDMSFQNKLSYLWEYYKFHAAIAIAIIVFASYLIYNIVTPNIESQLYVAMVNNTIDAPVLEEYRTNFADYLQLDPKTESVDFNTGFYFTENSEYSLNMKQVLITYVHAQQVDVIIAPESEFIEYAYNGFLDPLSDQLPTDIYSSLTDSFYITDLVDDTEKNAYGIYLTDAPLYKNNADNTDPYILGIVANSKQKDNTVEFIRSLFNQ